MSRKVRGREKSMAGSGELKAGSAVAVVFQSVFCAEIHPNNIFYFLKIIFDISTSK